jgi:hypothetical protein
MKKTWVCLALALFLGLPLPDALAQPGVEGSLLHGKGKDDAIRASTFRAMLQRAQDCVRANVDELLIGLAETLIAGASVDTGIDMLQAAAENCVPARNALATARKFDYRTAADIKRSHYRRLGLESYGTPGSLSYYARQRRLDPNLPALSGQRNIAVAEYVLDGKPDRILRFSEASGAKGHAERVIMRDLHERATVLRIYSERHPCSESCFAAINKDARFANATREYSFDHRLQSEVERWHRMAESSFPLPGASSSIVPSFPKLPGF